MTDQKRDAIMRDAQERVRALLPYVRHAAGHTKSQSKQVLGNEENAKFGSSVTEVDKFIQDFIIVSLASLHPDIGFIAEESTWVTSQVADAREYCVLIDPIDGTSWFIKGDSDYSILVGIVKDRAMVGGFGVYPATGEFFVAVADGCLHGNFEADAAPATRVALGTSPSKVLAAHYRLTTKAFSNPHGRLKDSGWSIRTNGDGFGTNLSGARMVLQSQARALVAPFMSIHDGFVPAKLIEAAGGKLAFFDPMQDGDKWIEADAWHYRTIEDRSGVSRRCRFIAAESEGVLAEILRLLRT